MIAKGKAPATYNAAVDKLSHTLTAEQYTRMQSTLEYLAKEHDNFIAKHILSTLNGTTINAQSIVKFYTQIHVIFVALGAALAGEQDYQRAMLDLAYNAARMRDMASK